MVDVDECFVWPLLRLVEFYRFDENDKTSAVFSTLRLSYELNRFKITLASRDST